MILIDETKINKTKKCNGLWIRGGKKNGEWKKWWSNGNLRKHYICKNGKLHGKLKIWSSNGNLINCHLYENGKRKQWWF